MLHNVPLNVMDELQCYTSDNARKLIKIIFVFWLKAVKLSETVKQ